MLTGVIAIFLFLIFYYLNNKDKKIMALNPYLYAGIILITLASFIFSISTFSVISGLEKTIILGVETILLFVLSMYFKYALKSNKTSDAFTLLGIIIFGITMFSLGYNDVLGSNFSVRGKFGNIFLMMISLIELCLFLTRKIILKTKGTISILIFSFLSLFFLINQITASRLFSLSLLSVLLVIINLFKENVFDDKEGFNRFNLSLMVLFSMIFFASCPIFITGINGSTFDGLGLIIFAITLCFNAFYSTKKMSEIFLVLSLAYDFIVVSWLCAFSGSFLISACVLYLLGLSMFVIYYISKKESLRFIAIIISYLCGFFAPLLILMSKDNLILSLIMSLSYFLFSIINLIKNKDFKMFDFVFQPIFIFMLIISSTFLLGKFYDLDVFKVMIISDVILFLSVVITRLIGSKIKNGYAIALVALLFFQMIFLHNASLFYSLITLVFNVLLVILSFTIKDEFFNKLTLPFGVLLILNVLIGLTNYPWVKMMVFSLVLLILSIVTKDNKKRWLCASLAYFPLVMFLEQVLSVRFSVMHDLRYILLMLFFLIFTRKFLNLKDDNNSCVLELILFSFVGLVLLNNLFDLLFIMLTYLLSYVFGYKKIGSGKNYLNYLLFITPIIYFKIDETNNVVLYLLIILGVYVLNQIMYRLFYDGRNKFMEVVHLLISFLLMTNFVSYLPFSNGLLAIISFVFLFTLSLIYENEKIRLLSFALVFYPVLMIIDTINNTIINNILSMFILFVPIFILIRYVLKLDDKVSAGVESVVLSFMFLPFIFEINFIVMIVLCGVCLLLITIGKLLKYNSLLIIGFVFIILTIAIQTRHVWFFLPWWFYVLIIGIILVIISVIMENKG